MTAKCIICGSPLTGGKRKYCSRQCERKGSRERKKYKKSAVPDNFTEYDRACIEARERGEHLSYGKFMADKLIAVEKIKIGG